MYYNYNGIDTAVIQSRHYNIQVIHMYTYTYNVNELFGVHQS